MIDLHVHCCDPDRYPVWQEACRLTGTDRGAFVSLPCLDAPEGSFNSYVLRCLELGEGRWIGFGALDHRRMPSNGSLRSPYAEQLRRMKQEGFAGLKLWLGKPLAARLFKVDLQSMELRELYECAREERMPILCHIADPPDFWEPGGPYGDGTFRSFGQCLDDARFLLESCPDVPVIFAHLLFLGEGLAGLSAMLDRYPGMYFDTAPGRWFFHTLDRQREAAQTFFRTYAQRIMFGSDSCLFPEPVYGLQSKPTAVELRKLISHAVSFFGGDELLENPYPGSRTRYPQVRGLDLPQAVMERLLAGNARSFLEACSHPQSHELSPVFDLPAGLAEEPAADPSRNSGPSRRTVSDGATVSVNKGIH